MQQLARVNVRAHNNYEFTLNGNYIKEVDIIIETCCFFRLSAGVSVHTDLFPTSTSLVRNFLGPSPERKKSLSFFY